MELFSHTRGRAKPGFDTHEKTWPTLRLEEWKDTYETLHLWTQIVGKIPLTLCPRENHWWQCALRVTPRGLATRSIPQGNRSFELEFDFLDHALRIRTCEGMGRSLALQPQTVAEFYHELMEAIQSLGFQLTIDRMPKELPDAIAFDQDEEHAAYDPDYANRHWRILLQADRIFQKFRSEFIGKCSPVHFFWGSFDLCVTRFSGRPAPARPGADAITREAYSHEVLSVGFWPGSGNIAEAAFYAYAAPEPAGFSASRILPAEAFYNPPSHGFVLPYEEVRRAPDPDRMVLDFCRSTYQLGADLGGWDRAALERHPRTVSKAA